MKKISLMAAVILIAVTLNAQPPQPGERTGPSKPDYAALQQDLNLSDDQLARLKETDRSFHEEMMKLRESNQKMTEEGRKELDEKRLEVLKTFLSEDQLAKMEEFRRQNRPQGNPGAKPGCEGGPK